MVGGVDKEELYHFDQEIKNARTKEELQSIIERITSSLNLIQAHMANLAYNGIKKNQYKAMNLTAHERELKNLLSQAEAKLKKLKSR